MRRILALFLLLLPFGAHAAIAVLQTQAKAVGSGTTIASQQMQSSLTSGSTLVVALSFETQTVSAVTVTDTVNGSYTLDANSGMLAGNSGNGGGRILFFHVANTYGGVSAGLAITASWTTSSVGVMSVYELSGCTSCAFDLAATAKSGTGSLTSLAYSITPTGSGEFVVGVGLAAGAGGLAVDSGYTFPSNDEGVTWCNGGSLDYHCHEYAASVSGAQSLKFGGTSSTGASMYAAAYKIGGATCTHAGWTASGALTVPTAGVTSVWVPSEGKFDTVDCSSKGYSQPSNSGATGTS